MTAAVSCAKSVLIRLIRKKKELSLSGIVKSRERSAESKKHTLIITKKIIRRDKNIRNKIKTNRVKTNRKKLKSTAFRRAFNFLL